MLKLISALALSTAFLISPVLAVEKAEHHPQKTEKVVPKEEHKVAPKAEHKDGSRHCHHHWYAPWHHCH